MKRLAVMSAAILSLLSLTMPASAQYSPPSGSVSVSTSDPTPVTGSSVTLSLSLGGPAVAGVQCTVSIDRQPGTDAAILGPSVLTTDSSGNVSLDLFVGSTPGLLVLSVSCSNGAAGSLSMSVGSSPRSISARTAADPLGAGTSPDANDASDAGSSSSMAFLLGALGVLVVSSSVVVGGRLLTRKR